MTTSRPADGSTGQISYGFAIMWLFDVFNAEERRITSLLSKDVGP